jgi:hypothetical protein
MRKQDTGFRNEDLFCFNCGTAQKIPMPIDMRLAADFMKSFAKIHKNCPKTWTEPIPETKEQTEYECATWWAGNGEHGISSKTMFNHLAGGTVSRLQNLHEGYPSDPDDFKRCYKLLQAVPQWKNRLNELKPLSPVWSNLVDNWDKLTEMYEQNERENWKNYKKIGMYEFMKDLGA